MSVHCLAAMRSNTLVGRPVTRTLLSGMFSLAVAMLTAQAGAAPREAEGRMQPLQLAQAAKPPASTPAGLDALIKAARAEGELTIYYTMSENIARRINDAFTGRYGVKTQSLRIVLLQQRYAAEMTSNAVAADVLFQSSTLVTFAEEGIKKGWIDSIADAALPVVGSGEFPAKFNRGSAAIVQISPWSIGYNTAKLKGVEVPKDWPDILHPRFRGQILVANTASSFAYNDFWAVILDRYGESFFTALRAQSLRVYSSGTPASQALGAGEGMLQIPIVTAVIQDIKDKGAPVDTVIPAYTTGVEIQVALTSRARAKHPAAARLYANFVMSPEGNRIFNADPGSYSIYDDKNLPREYVSPSLANQARAPQLRKLLGQE